MSIEEELELYKRARDVCKAYAAARGLLHSLRTPDEDAPLSVLVRSIEALGEVAYGGPTAGEIVGLERQPRR